MIDTTEIGTYQRIFAAKYAQLAELLADLPAEALRWKPFETSPWKGPAGSLGWLIAHSASSTVYLLKRAEWIMDRIPWEEVNGDEGSDEFGPANHDPAYLLARLERTHAYVNTLLAGLSPDDLAASRFHPRRTTLELSVRHEIQHAFEHMSEHIGHAQLTRQLWAVQGAPPV